MRRTIVFSCLSVTAVLLLAADLEVIHIDAGQGDSIFIEGPDGTTVLIDGGGGACNSGHPKGYIYDVLNANGISVANPLDYIVLTHYHLDHHAYLDEVIQDYGCPTQAIYDRGGTHKWSSVPSPIPIPTSYMDACNSCPGARQQLDLWMVDETDSWNFANHRGIDLGGGAKLICVAIGYPVTAAGTGDDPTGQKDIYVGKDENNMSAVFLLSYDGYQETLGGDLGSDVEPDLAQALKDPIFNCLQQKSWLAKTFSPFHFG